MSGSGKSVALAVLEDEGFYCVDNLPVALIGPLVKSQQARGTRQMALAADVRVGADLAHLEKALSELRAEGIGLTVLFLNARSDILLQRYSETRRRHPMAPAEDPATGIAREIDLLAPVRVRADVLIDTTDLPPHDLRA
ncbi:MAG: RNase adaptor protein RapZ, partial [Betaproteobacteria bacterium]|nr:RNase adaptor protein RapZ [Betaproteobacteria bacterium]